MTDSKESMPVKEPELPNGITYGGKGPVGEYYAKEISDLATISLWTKSRDEECWTAEELRAISTHQEWLDELR